MGGSHVVVEKVRHEEEGVARRLVEMLRARETHALFILGNLVNGYAGSHVYVARRGEAWVGVAAFYAGHKSCSMYADDAGVVRAMVRHVAREHPQVEMVLAIDPVGRHAYDAMIEMGYVSLDGEPREVFMEMTIPEPFERVAHEEKVRAMEERDAMACARLQRLLSSPGDESPIREEEIHRVLSNKDRMVLEVEGEVASTATTNGLAVEAFQILGVATFPEHRGRGYARAVCAALIRRMQGRGARRCVLFTGPENVAAQRCYEGLGFRVVGGYWMAKFRRE